ncbi:hypothetical protein [Campylobacter sp. MG1]|uniref:hypothetical protein n=1 Tax=Campylobacter sp. MG1 TaxID=2976332 RepID=UPI00226CE62D|nr:hypothetical protein [Campylobacter sp. MG1]
MLKIEDGKDFCMRIFSTIFKNSYDIYYNLSIMKLVKEFIIDQNQKLRTYNRIFSKVKINYLIKHYNINDAKITYDTILMGKIIK